MSPDIALSSHGREGCFTEHTDREGTVAKPGRRPLDFWLIFYEDRSRHPFRLSTIPECKSQRCNLARGIQCFVGDHAVCTRLAEEQAASVGCRAKRSVT